MENSSYLNLARKYRPQIMEDLIGQDFLVQTLNNAFLLNKVAHAFMLTGVRGVGKTTTARIIAKALNCVGADGNGGITLNPCGKCENCIAILEDRHMDVIEMDAASRTGVDDVREIIENSRYKPVSARFKVFIIDEVHMLSKNAFNALLKTLEEPPAHLKFIFATTEIKKVPITVLSRCQRFDLKRIDVEMLKTHLANICNKEKISFEEEALLLLARVANGSVRDSLSLLDQAIVFGQNHITYNSVKEMIGSGNLEQIYAIFKSLIVNDVALATKLFYGEYEKSLQLENFLEDILEICHNAIAFNIFNKVEMEKILGINANEYEKISEINSLTKQEHLILLWQILSKSLVELKDANNPLHFIHMLFFKIANINNILNVNMVLDTIQLDDSNQIIADKSKVLP
jgi:DNA polymerase-3 subunit gamma/tau